MTHSTSNNWQDLLASMQTGDVLSIKFKETTIYTALLRRIGDLFFFSMPTEGICRHILAPDNPHQWDAKQQSLVGYNRKIPQWWLSDITLNRGVAMEAVRLYEATPRFNPDSSIEITLKMIRSFEKSDRSRIFEGMIMNNEAGPDIDRLHMVLQMLGIDTSNDNVFALQVYFSSLLGREVFNMLSTAIVCVADTTAIHTDENKSSTRH